jgi:Fe-S cluster assembly protein SufD
MTESSTLLRRALADIRPRDDPAWAWLRTHGLPTAREEGWRYAALDQIVAEHYEADRSRLDAVDGDLVATAGDHGGPRLVLVDGTFAPELSDVTALPAGVRIGWGPDAGTRPGPRYDGFRALNRLAGPAAAEVCVARAARVSAPIHIVHVTSGGRGAISHPRTAIRVGQDAEVDLIETYLGPPSVTLTNAVTSIGVDRDALLRHH